MNKKYLKIALISNIIFEPYIYSAISCVFEKLSVIPLLVTISFEEYFEQSSIESLLNVDIIIVALNFEVMYPNYQDEYYSAQMSIDDITDNAIFSAKCLYKYLKNISKASILWFGFEDYYTQFYNLVGNIFSKENVVDSINLKLKEMIYENDVFIDIKRLIANVGISNAYDLKGKYRWNAPYSKLLITAISDEVYKQYEIIHCQSKKCIVLDCDNVLWGGILSEDGIERILLDGNGLGRPFQDFQRFLLYLYYDGVILTVCSKNDELDVLRVFREHSGMILKEEHIVNFQINWGSKSENIRRISEELNIGLNSIVFIDDSQHEINEVNTLLPEVFTVLYNRRTVYNDLSCFSLKQKIDYENIRLRNSTYRTNADRKALRKMFISEDEYLKSLEMNVDIHEAKDCELARIAELTQRTNKCTNGVRYTFDELKTCFEDPNYNLFSVFLSDRFSNLGLVGVIGIKYEVIDLFSLSCRAVGRNIDNEMLGYVKKCGTKWFRFSSTGKNLAVQHLFKECKFKIKNI